jgi:hypothetical protein
VCPCSDDEGRDSWCGQEAENGESDQSGLHLEFGIFDLGRSREKVASLRIAVGDELIRKRNCAFCTCSPAADTSSTNISSMGGNPAVMSFTVGWLGLTVPFAVHFPSCQGSSIAVPGFQHQ